MSRKLNVKISILFIFFLFTSISITQKLYRVCEYYVYQNTDLLPSIFLFGFGAVYKSMAMNLFLKTRRVLGRQLLWLLFSFPGMACIIRPHLDYWTHATMSKQKFDYSFPYLFDL